MVKMGISAFAPFFRSIVPVTAFSALLVSLMAYSASPTWNFSFWGNSFSFSSSLAFGAALSTMAVPSATVSTAVVFRLISSTFPLVAVTVALSSITAWESFMTQLRATEPVVCL